MSEFKPLASRKKEELLELCEGFEINVPNSCRTNKAIISLLEENGINNKRLKIMETEDERPVQEEEDTPQLNSNQCVVVMERSNSSYGFKRYLFSREKPYVLMEKPDAEELVSSEPGFRVASVDEIMRNFKA